MQVIIENTQIPDDVILATFEISSFYTNIPQSDNAPSSSFLDFLL